MIAEKIKTYINENKISYEFVSDGIGISVEEFDQMLNGAKKITVEDYFAICSVLQLDEEYFILQALR